MYILKVTVGVKIQASLNWKEERKFIKSYAPDKNTAFKINYILYGFYTPSTYNPRHYILLVKNLHGELAELVDCGGLENRWPYGARGFESLTLRKNLHSKVPIIGSIPKITGWLLLSAGLL